MKTLLSIVVAGVFAAATVGVFTAAHGGAMSDADKVE